MTKEAAVTIPLDVLERLVVMAAAADLYSGWSPWDDQDREAVKVCEREIAEVRKRLGRG